MVVPFVQKIFVDEQEQDDSIVLLGALHRAIGNEARRDDPSLWPEWSKRISIGEVLQVVSGNSASDTAKGLYQRAIAKVHRWMEQQISFVSG